jgi:K(+)-stimulated pyrophosphate-energized sodium pump
MRASSTVSLVQVTGSNLNLVYVVLAISLGALGVAYALRAQVLAASDGTAKMREIAEAVQEGAAAFLSRQFRTLSYFVAIVFVLLFALPGDAEIRIGRSIFSLVTTVCGLQFAQMCESQMLHVIKMARRPFKSLSEQVALLE